MPTTAHEVPLEMVRNQPQLVLTILRTVFGLDLPEDATVVEVSDAHEHAGPGDFYSDAALRVTGPDGREWGIVVEVQLRRDPGKAFSWPVYLSMMRERSGCPVILLVWCPNKTVAAACAEPIEMGHPGWVLEPLAFHPGQLPHVTDPDQARRFPELAVLSAIGHADGPHAKAALTSAAAAIDAIDRHKANVYYDYLASQLPEPARELLANVAQTTGYKRSDSTNSHIA